MIILLLVAHKKNMAIVLLLSFNRFTFSRVITIYLHKTIHFDQCAGDLG